MLAEIKTDEFSHNQPFFSDTWLFAGPFLTNPR
jgi:hypothetical protein